jgi:FkbM family methyltransferase
VTTIARLDYAPREIRMYVSTPIEESYRLRACAKEPWTVAWIESMPDGSVLYDIGANVGSYTLLAAALGHTVVAIEPSFANYARLCENVLLNDLAPKVIPLCLAVGRQMGTLVMQQELTPGYSGGMKHLRVPMLPLVDLHALFGLPAATHVKLDTDGNVADVVEGAPSWSHVSWMIEVPGGNGSQTRINHILGEPLQTYNMGWDPATHQRTPANNSRWHAALYTRA